MKMEEIAYIGIFVLLAITVATITTVIQYTLMPYCYTYNMYFKPGIYVFTTSGKYYYYPTGGNNTILLTVDAGGSFVIDNYVYLNDTTIDPGYHYVVFIPFKTFNVNSSLFLSGFVSVIVFVLLQFVTKKFSESRP